MSLNQSLIAELKHEAANTRKMLERVPFSKSEWAPHVKSTKLGRLATHIAQLPRFITVSLTTGELDFSKGGFPNNIAGTTEELLDIHDKTVADAVAALEQANDSEFANPWTLRNGEHVIFTMPKALVIRNLALNHIVHHRGQLSVYLRELDVPLPSIYGPTADEAVTARPATTTAS